MTGVKENLKKLTNKQDMFVCVFVKKERQKICVVKQQNMTT